MIASIKYLIGQFSRAIYFRPDMVVESDRQDHISRPFSTTRQPANSVTSQSLESTDSIARYACHFSLVTIRPSASAAISSSGNKKTDAAQGIFFFPQKSHSRVFQND